MNATSNEILEWKSQTQETSSSGESAEFRTSPSKDDSKLPKDEYTSRGDAVGGADHDHEDIVRPRARSHRRPNQKDYALSAVKPPIRIFGNIDSRSSSPLPVGEASRYLSRSSARTGSPTTLRAQELQNSEKQADLNANIPKLRTEGESPRIGDLKLDGGHRDYSRQSLRQRAGRRSQSSGPFPALPMQQEILHVNDFMQQQNYILKVCRALMMYGAPTHRLEDYMHITAEVLGLRLQSFYMPGCMIISFNDTLWRSTEVHVVRCTQALNLSKLYDVRAVYKDVIHDNLTLGQATVRLDEIMAEDDKFPRWIRVLMYGLASASIGPVSFGARPIDLPVIFLLGSLLGFMQLILAEKSELYSHVFEISATILTSFLARAFGSINLGHGRGFCFSAIAQASLVMILPGFTITNSALELQSKNIISGSVRMVYGIIYISFLAFGITVGTTIYGAMDSSATSATTCDTTWPFWWKLIFVAPFTLFYIIICQGKWSKMPTMLIISLIGWLVNHFSALYFVANLQISQALGALSVGIVANLLSRLGLGLAVALLHPAIFLQVPGSLAASGSLISGIKNSDQLTHAPAGLANGTVAASGAQANTAVLNAGYSMVEIAIGITVGLSVSALVVYPFRKKRGKSGLFTF